MGATYALKLYCESNCKREANPKWDTSTKSRLARQRSNHVRNILKEIFRVLPHERKISEEEIVQSKIFFAMLEFH